MKKYLVIITVLLYSIMTYAQTKPFTVLLDWYPNPDHAPLFVAQEYGFFKQHDLDVQLISPTDPGDPLKLMAAGKADIAVSYQPTLLVAVDAGLPVVRIGTLINTPLNAIAVLQSSTIKTIANLKGKRIGYVSDASAHAMLDTALASAGLTEKDVELINVRYGLTQALMSGKVDAITGIMRNFESLELAEHHHPARMFPYENYGIPSYDELILAVQRDRVTDPKLCDFMQALTEATAYLLKNPETTWQTFATAHPELDNHFNHAAWLATLPYFDTHPAQLNAARYQQFAEYWHQRGAIKQAPSLDTYAVNFATQPSCDKMSEKSAGNS